MTATASSTNGWVPEDTGTQLPAGQTIPLQSNAQAGQGQAVYFDGSGNAALNDGTVPGLVCGGVVFPDKTAGAASSSAGQYQAMVHEGFGGGAPASTISQDGFTAADVITPCFDAGNGVPGKLSNSSGSNRSFMGLVLGLFDNGNPRVWAGRVASVLARCLHAIINESAGNLGYAADASASTDQGSLSLGELSTIGQVIPRAKRHGVITSVEIIPSATQAHAATNYRQVKIWKVDTTGGVSIANSPLVATFDTSSQDLTIGQPTAFTLGAASALNLLETDILVMTSVHSGSGVALPQSAIRCNFKVI